MDVPSKNPENNKRGRLIMAANAIGNPKDIPARSLLAVQTADLVIFEEDRGARSILKAAGIHREYWRYSEHRQLETMEKLKETLLQGKTAVYMSDQGMPVLEDPGSSLLELAYKLGSVVQIVPGPSSVISALSACPFVTHEFYFAGFLPKSEQDRIKKLFELKKMKVPLVILDTPYRLKHLVESCIHVFGTQEKSLLALDLSGESENFIFKDLGTLKSILQHTEEKLNFVLIIQNSIPSK